MMMKIKRIMKKKVDELKKIEKKYVSRPGVHAKTKQSKIKTSKLNEILLPIIENYPPPAYKAKYVKIKYIMQLPTPQPQFAFFCNLPQYVKDPYKRFLENKLREHFNFHGVPISVYMRQK